MLIAEVGRGGAPRAAQPRLQAFRCEKTVLKAETSKQAGETIAAAFLFLYRSWIPDEDLGMSVGELVCRDLQVGHQHLHAFPVETHRGHVCHPSHT